MKLHLLMACFLVTAIATPDHSIAEGKATSRALTLSCVKYSVKGGNKFFRNNCSERIAFLVPEAEGVGCKIAGRVNLGGTQRFPVAQKINAVCALRREGLRLTSVESMKACDCVYR